MPTLRSERELEVVWNGGELLPPRDSHSLAADPSAFIDAPALTARQQKDRDAQRRQARKGSDEHRAKLREARRRYEERRAQERARLAGNATAPENQS